MIYIVIYRGADFRKEFRSLRGLWALTDVSFAALSASLPPEVQSNIISSLQLLSPVVSCSLNRPNVFFSASPIECKFNLVIDDVWASTQRDLDGLSSLLQKTGSCDAPKTIVYV